MKTRIYLIRHAEAEGNTKKYFQGHLDGKVTPHGLEQLDMLAGRCRGIPFDAVFASPLSRALMTASAADRYHGLEIVPSPGLIEINGGCWEGKGWDEITQLYPEDFSVWNKNPWLFAPEGGETMREVYDRIWRAVTDIVRACPGGRLCLVSHACAIRNFTCRAMGLPIERLGEVPWCGNTAINIIDFDAALTPEIVALNDMSHLGPAADGGAG